MVYLILLFFILYYIFIRLSKGITRSTTCLIGKTVILTGANSGIGYGAALNLASRGCRLILADYVNLDETKKNIIKFTNNTNIITKHLDLRSLSSVRSFADEILTTESRLDILINNAGVGMLENVTYTEDGLHPVMQINYFGHFLLTHLLIKMLKKSAPSRIVFTSSSQSFLNNLTLDNLNFRDSSELTLMKLFPYNNSKLVMLIASDIFGEKLQSAGITSVAVHPGIVATPIFGKSTTRTNFLLTFLMSLYNVLYSKDAWEGSQVLVHAAVSKKLDGVVGGYLWDCKPFWKPAKAKDGKFCKKIWEESERLVQLKDEEKIL